MFDTICDWGDALTYVVLKTLQLSLPLFALAVFVVEAVK